MSVTLKVATDACIRFSAEFLLLFLHCHMHIHICSYINKCMVTPTTSAHIHMYVYLYIQIINWNILTYIVCHYAITIFRLISFIVERKNNNSFIFTFRDIKSVTASCAPWPFFGVAALVSCHFRFSMDCSMAMLGWKNITVRYNLLTTKASMHQIFIHWTEYMIDDKNKVFVWKNFYLRNYFHEIWHKILSKTTL